MITARIDKPSGPASGLPRAHRVLAALTAAAFALIGVTAFAPAASASAPANHQVTLCHATNSDANPYVLVTVDVTAGGLQGGHDDHTGPVWNPTLKANHQSWGDIIPAFSYTEFTFAGLNLTAEGQAILDNGCQIPAAQAITVTPEAAAVSTPTCDVPDLTVTLPSTTGITYTASGSLTLAPGESVTVTPSADTGYALTDGSAPQTITNQFDPATCAVEPTAVTPEAATVSTPTCDVPDLTVTLPSTTGITYTASGSLTLAPGESVTITPSADTGYALTDGSAPQTITNELDTTACSGVLPEGPVTDKPVTHRPVAHQPATRPTAGVLAETGAGPIRDELLWAVGLVLAGGLLTGVTRRRQSS
ncbi:MAG: hypothetical protein QOH14_1859 [Pseudonocardiales bacterium]|nr:hypothetical protein [Pseudonocardiales bacterium]